MDTILAMKGVRLFLLGSILVLALTVAYISFKTPSLFVAVETNNHELSYLAAVHGSYSRHQPQTHSTYTQQAQALPAPVADVASTTPVVVTTSPTPAPTTSAATASSAKLAATTTSTLTALGSKFGISVGATLSWLNKTDLNAELTDIQSLGVGWVRYDFEWDQIQSGGKTSYDWAVTDRVVKAIIAHHMQVLPVVAYTPTWARPAGCASMMCAPADPADYAAFAKAVAAHYGPMGVHTYEIWNEPNIHGFWQPAPNVAAYSALLKGAYGAIKSVDPTATVVSAGLAPAATTATSIAPVEFVAGMYLQGDKSFFDGLGFHPYTFPALPSDTQSWNAWAQMSVTTNNIRGIMVANGDSAKQIWMTEFGAPTGGSGALATLTNFNYDNSPDHVDEALQNTTLTSAVSLWSKDTWAGPLFWYSYKDLGVAPTTNENFFGLLRYDGSPKPAYTTLKMLLAQ